MNLSFFRRRKTHPSAVSSSGVETEEQERFSSSPANETDRVASSSASTDPGEQFEVPLDEVFALLPDAAVNRRGAIEGTRFIRLSLKQVLPQLAKGRVMVPLGDILSQLPSELLASPSPYSGSEKIQIPLDCVVAHISPDRLQLPKNQQAVEVSEDEIPSPFTEDAPPSSSDWLQAQTPAAAETPVEEPRASTD